jgi:putative DNA primase/helicase
MAFPILNAFFIPGFRPVLERMVLPEQWRSEVAKGFDAPALARAMIERGLIIPAGDGKAAKPVKVPGHGTVRLYVLAPGIIGDAEGNDAG